MTADRSRGSGRRPIIVTALGGLGGLGGIVGTVWGAAKLLPPALTFLSRSPDLVAAGALALVAAYGVRIAIHAACYLRPSSGGRLIGMVLLEIVFAAAWMRAAAWAFEGASGARVLVVDLVGIVCFVALNHVTDGARRAARKPRTSQAIRHLAVIYVKPALRRFYLGWLVDIVTMAIPRPRASTFMLSLGLMLGLNMALSLPAAYSEFADAIRPPTQENNRNEPPGAGRDPGPPQPQDDRSAPRPAPAPQRPPTAADGAEPSWAELCAGSPGPSSAPAPPPQRSALELAFRHEGAKYAGCTPAPAAAVDPADPTGAWTQVGYCGGRPISLVVASKDGEGALLMSRQPVAVGQALAEQQLLSGSSQRFPVLSGNAYVISTHRGNAVLIQPRVATTPSPARLRSCQDLTENAVPFAELPPEMAALWSGLNETVFTWPYSEDGSLVTGDGSYTFVSPDTGEAVATGHCRSGVCEMNPSRAGSQPSTAPASQAAIQRASQR